jgi:hypothetical protein
LRSRLYFHPSATETSDLVDKDFEDTQAQELSPTFSEMESVELIQMRLHSPNRALLPQFAPPNQLALVVQGPVTPISNIITMAQRSAPGSSAYYQTIPTTGTSTYQIPPRLSYEDKQNELVHRQLEAKMHL